MHQNYPLGRLLIGLENPMMATSLVGLEPAWIAVAHILKKGPEGLMELDCFQWEELIAASYHKEGYDEVILTSRSADFGRDVIAIKNGWGSVRIVDQVKAYKPGHRVTANDVRTLIGVLGVDRSATKAVFSTTSEFAPKIETDPSIAPLIPYRLELCDGPNLIERLRCLSNS